MKKSFILVLIALLLLLPTVVSAQDTVKIKQLDIQLWPEHDRPEVLVMYTISLPDEIILPAEINIRIPADADLTAVAKSSEGDKLYATYDPLTQDGDWQVFTLIVDESTLYHVEYYMPLKKDGITRNISFLWKSEHDVEALFIEILEPPNIENLSSNPLFTNTLEENGNVFHAQLREKVKAGDRFELNISYDKDNDDLTVSSMPIEVGGASPESKQSSLSLSDSLPMILVGIGIALIIGGLLYFFLAGRNEHSSTPKRKRHKASSGTKYCHQCGSRSNGNDKFCRSCGVKLRSKS